MAVAREARTLEDDVDAVFGLQDDLANTDTQTDDNSGEQNAADTNVDAATTPRGDGEQQADLFEGLAPPLKDKPLRDDQGRIVDKDGNVIAATREEKQNMFNYNRLRHTADKIAQRNTQLEGEITKLQRIRDLPAQLGITVEQMGEAAQYRAGLERDPINTVRDIVAGVMQKGYTMQQLFGDDAPSTLNAGLIRRELQQHLQPITERFATEQREQRVQERATNDMQDFVANHQFAEVHGDAIANLVGRNEGMSPEKAYYELRMWAADRGLDFSQPLGPQVQQQRQQPSQRQPQQRFTPGSRSMQNGNAQPMQQAQVFGPETSYKDIVANAFRNLASGS